MSEETKFDPEAFTKLSEQVDNLNKGIATSRDEVKVAKAESATAVETAKAATDALEAYKKENGIKKDKPVEDLSKEEQKKFDAYMESQGVITKKEMEEQQQATASQSAKDTATTAVSEFLEKHPEYDEDDKWQAVQEEFNLYKTPTDLASYRKLLERVHSNLTGSTKENARASARAEINKQKSLTRGGNGGGAGSASDNEAEIDKMQEQYPSLSRGQIEARLAEVDDLYPDKDDKK